MNKSLKFYELTSEDLTLSHGRSLSSQLDLAQTLAFRLKLAPGSQATKGG